jgi:Peptidase family M23
MATTRTYTAARRLAALAIVLGLVAGLLAFGATALAGSSNEGCTGSYGWPVKPFDRAHPIRGSFGDPRTVFAGPPTLDTLLTGGGKFSFHQGVDISAPDGTPVYAVASGTVIRVTREVVGVTCGNGRAFDYWHVTPKVRVGQRVEAGQTVLGFVQRPSNHVHLTQVEHGRVVNPVASGRLTPYRDTTPPQILGTRLRKPGEAHDELPQFVRGPVELIVEAIDDPAVRVPGNWSGLPVTPARLTWRLEKWPARVVVSGREARDVREALPANERFWETYARGTSQNFAAFRSHYSYLQSGHYLFLLTPRPFDTRKLRDGVYTLFVSAEDTAGNRDVHSLRFTVHNQDGWN